MKHQKCTIEHNLQEKLTNTTEAAINNFSRQGFLTIFAAP